MDDDNEREPDPVKQANCLTNSANGYTSCIKTITGWTSTLALQCAVAAKVSGKLADTFKFVIDGEIVTAAYGVYCSAVVANANDGWTKDCDFAKGFEDAVCNAEFG